MSDLTILVLAAAALLRRAAFIAYNLGLLSRRWIMKTILPSVVALVMVTPAVAEHQQLHGQPTITTTRGCWGLIIDGVAVHEKEDSRSGRLDTRQVRAASRRACDMPAKSLSHVIALWLPVTASVLSGCGDGTPQSAKGETPYRYVVCSVGDTGCFVTARFKDLSECEEYREREEMYCDSVSTPGQITCRKESSQHRIAVAYCTM